MQKLKLYNDDSFDSKIFKKTSISINPGLTVLVGKNGAGKSTALRQIESQLKIGGMNVIFHDNYGKDSPALLSSWAADCDNWDYVIEAGLASEGQNIMLALGNFAEKTRTYIHKTITEGKTSAWFLLDAIDSGLSINGIVDFKEFITHVVDDGKIHGLDVYFLVAANSYELARGERCLDIRAGKYVSFDGYESYREFILGQN